MSVGSGLSIVSELVKQNSLFNFQQYSAAQEGLKFAQTALKSSKLTFASQETKLRQSVEQGQITSDELSSKLAEVQRQSQIDCGPWEIYVKKLEDLIENYSSKQQKKTKRVVETVLPSKRTRITFASSSSESEGEIVVEKEKEKEKTRSIVQHDRSTTTDPSELALRSEFPPASSTISFTAKTNRRIRRIPIEQLNEFVAQQIVRLHDEGEWVRWNDVVWRLFVHYQVDDIGHFGLTRVDQIPSVDHLVRIQNKIDTYLDAYGYYHNLGTLGELENDLARLFHKENYRDLFIGPIEKQSKIIELFRLRSTFGIRKDLKSSDILKYLDDYMTKERSWTADKDIDIVDFLKFFAEKVRVEKIDQLGVRIKSVYLSRTCIKAMQTNQRKTMEIARNQLNEMLNDLAENEVKKIRRNIEENLSQTNPIDCLNELIEICRTICYDYASFRKFSNLFQSIIAEPMLKNLFQIALTRRQGSSSIQREIQPKKTYFSSSSSSSSSNSEDDEDETEKTFPTDEEILQTIRHLIKSIDSMNFRQLSRIEDRICEKFHLKTFDELRRGSFVKFLSKYDENLFPGAFHRSNDVRDEEIGEFLSKAKEKVSDRFELENLVKFHFDLEKFSLIESEQRSMSNVNVSNRYECLIVDSFRFDSTSNNIDDLTRKALSEIDRCFLLNELHKDLQWNRFYRSTLGSFKSFLLRHQISFLETNSKTFLKISSTSQIEDFRNALWKKNVVETAGHFVSILVQFDSIRLAPLKFFSRILDEFLSTEIFDDDELRQFFSDVFQRIPSLILCETMKNVFATISTRFNDDFERKILSKDQKPIVVLRRPTASSSTSKENSTTKSSCRQIVERIRREKFGIGIDLNDENEILTEKFKSLVGRSLERLSKDLYNTETHFVLELIQNADDNQYENVDMPSICFRLDENSIELFNNEIGFNEENIEALCDIGKSTKFKHQRGVIGQKGIGFKSVFTVTDRPEIRSNGFQIRFDVSNGPIGFILPEWIDDERSTKINETNIFLPLKNSLNEEKLFRNLRPSLLLFLNRIRSIQIENLSKQTSQIFQRFDWPNSNVVELRRNENDQKSIERWFVVKRSLEMNFSEFPSTSDVALAFPLDEFPSLSSKEVFAYLPLRHFGFSFIIHGDFEVPSSRQDILVDSLWNQMILSSIPQIFLSSLDEFENERNVLPIDPLFFFLSFVPRPNSTSQFGSVSNEIFHQLKQRRFLPSNHLPSECILIDDVSEKNFLPQRYFLLDENFHRYSSILYQLGVRRFDAEILVEFLEENLSTIDDENLSEVFSKFSNFFLSISLKNEDELVRRLRSLKILPLRNSTKRVSFDENPDTLFLNSNDFRLSSSFENEFSIVSKDFSSQRRFFERLGIETLNEDTFLHRYAFPTIENVEIWQRKSSEIKIELCRFFFELSKKKRFAIDIERLKNSSIEFLVDDDKTFRSAKHFPIYFPVEFGNLIDLKEKFSQINWIFLSKIYLRKIDSIEDFRRFLQIFNIKHFLLPLHQWSNEQFEQIIERKSSSMSKNLFEEIQKMFLRFDDNEKNEFVRSKFFDLMKNSSWIPTTDEEFDRPSNIFLPNRQIEKLELKNLRFFQFDRPIDKNFAEICGFRIEIDSKSIVEQFVELSQKKNSTTIRQMSNFYEFLCQTMKISEIRSVFDEFPLIFVPNRFEKEFFSRSEVFWRNDSDSSIKIVEIYPSLKNFFVEILEIRSIFDEKKNVENLLEQIDQRRERRVKTMKNLDDLTHHVLDGRQSGIGASSIALENIGRQGEIWTFDFLRKKYQNEISTNEIEIFWLNEHVEQGKPFDFILKDFKTQQTIYIEVKSTISSTRQLIPMSFNELKFCCSLKDENLDYQIYRVYNIGQPSLVHLQIVKNIEENLRKHSLELFLLI